MFLPPSSRPDELEQTKSELAEAVRFGEEKIQIANQTFAAFFFLICSGLIDLTGRYDMVDKHVRRLDQDLKKFEQELADERQQSEALAEQTKVAFGKSFKRKRYQDSTRELCYRYSQ